MACKPCQVRAAREAAARNNTASDRTATAEAGEWQVTDPQGTVIYTGPKTKADGVARGRVGYTVTRATT